MPCAMSLMASSRGMGVSVLVLVRGCMSVRMPCSAALLCRVALGPDGEFLEEEVGDLVLYGDVAHRRLCRSFVAELDEELDGAVFSFSDDFDAAFDVAYVPVDAEPVRVPFEECAEAYCEDGAVNVDVDFAHVGFFWCGPLFIVFVLGNS